MQDVSRKKRLIYKQNQSPKPLTWVFQRMPLVFQLLLRVIVSPHIDIKKSHVSCSCAPSIMHSVCKLLPEEKTNRRWFLKYYSLAPQQVLRCRDKQQKPVIARRSPCCRRLAWNPGSLNQIDRMRPIIFCKGDCQEVVITLYVSSIVG